MGQLPVSVIIPIKNEEANLSRALQSVRWADEIWVVDSASTDRSPQIVADEDARRQRDQAGRAHIVQFHFNGVWPKKKNWALESLDFKNEWVFILDADEVLRADIIPEIQSIVGAAAGILDVNSPAGYWINRRFMFMGQWLKHAYYPNWNLRLFRHKLGRYEQLADVDTASGDNEVHEHIIVQGPTARLISEMDHFAFPSVGVFVEKHNRYSNWEARVTIANSLSRSASGIQFKKVGLRRKLKAFSRGLPLRPLLRFCYVYFAQRGFLDGRRGYYFARMHAVYELLCVAKEFELRQGVSRD